MIVWVGYLTMDEVDVAETFKEDADDDEEPLSEEDCTSEMNEL
jgi:hypothetical protein